jgi:nucleoside 2-deoxyribosyltransferase
MSARPPRLYLAGPDVFRFDVDDAAAELKRLCAAHGAEGRFPLDNALAPGPDLPARIRAANMAMIRGCDAVVANMTPFRGPSMDPGTAYEMGAAAALGKIVAGYTADPRPYLDRVRAFAATSRAGAVERDADGFAVEEFDAPLCDNLMMACGMLGPFGRAADAIAAAVEAWRGRK